VDSIWHGRGISQQLMAGVREAAAGFAGGTLWLKVWENNARALTFYDKNGFTDVGSADFFVGPDRQRDRVLVARID
ncbi:MAG: GNAT family N-acetyltransferase, partial [Dokdonella sp.]|uniref:GNAT family N-acetyltransferase n=1 Tax=Dokdonella sp. TaxID=2291710 RepID=UPI0032632F58